MGAITDAVRRYVPATYNQMLIAPTSSRVFATSDLQALADYVKFKLFSTSVDATLEASTYNPYENQFLGKLTTIQFIPAAVDYWVSQLSAIVSTGTGEVQNFRDHKDSLLKLWEILSKEVLEDAAVLGFSLKKIGLLPAVSYGDDGREILITPDPQCFPEPFKVTRSWVDELPWKTVA